MSNNYPPFKILRHFCCSRGKQGRRETNVGPGTAQTWIGTLKLDGPPLELKYDVMGPLSSSNMM